MKRLSRIFFIYGFFLFSAISAVTVSSDKIGFSVTLPDNWVVYKTTESSMSFEDTTRKYQSAIGIYHKNFAGDTLFSTPEEWTRARFVSYEIVINSDPVCALVFTDSVTVKQNGTYWAPEAYAYIFDLDTAAGEWAEYIRFTAVGTSGYELYVDGPKTDLDSNIVFYSGLIDKFQLRGSNAPVIQPAVKRHIPRASLVKTSTIRLNLLGQRFDNRQPDNALASQLIISQRKTSYRLR